MERNSLRINIESEILMLKIEKNSVRLAMPAERRTVLPVGLDTKQ